MCHNSTTPTMARRKRNRNTASSHKRNHNSAGSGRKWITRLVIALIVLILTPIIGGYQLINWLQGEGFRDKLCKTLANKAQADEVSIPTPLHIEDERVSIQSFNLRRCDIVQQVNAERIPADIDRGRLLDRVLHINKLTMEEASLRLDNSANGILPPVKDENDNLLQRLAPHTVNLKAFECTDSDLELKYNGALYSLTGCKVSAEPLTGTARGEWQILFENGRVHTPLSYLSNCSIKSAALICGKKSANLSECRFMLTPGELRARGNYNYSSKKWHLDLRANKANVERLLNNDWKKHLSGELYGTLKINGQGANTNAADGTISLQQAVLEALPILSSISFDNTYPYRSISLEKADCRVSYPYNRPAHNIKDAWLFDKINIRSTEGSLQVRGHVIICPDGALHGTLTIGLPESTVNHLATIAPQAAEKIFNAEGAPGYRWLNINLSGTVNAPREDLSARLGTILAADLPQIATGAAGNALHSTGELLNRIFTPATPEPDSQPQTEQQQRPGIISTANDLLNNIF